MPSRGRLAPELLAGHGPGRVAGVDEAGRGPLAGPVVAAAVILDSDRPVEGLADSKALSALQRERLEALIRERACAWAIGEASVQEIDSLNILQATMLAMCRAVQALQPAADHVLVDGNRLPALAVPGQAIVRGDATVAAIAAASVLAKVHRDRLCLALDRDWPAYGFALHKGYPTAAHLDALARHGACPAHRRSFAPVRVVLGPGGKA